MKPSPTRLEPHFVPRIWGARSLAPLFPEVTQTREPIGEVWLTGNDCRVANGPYAGRAFGEVWRELPPDWTGTRQAQGSQPPLLVKFLFPEEKLSVQVHPDDDYARQHEAAAGGTGKTEMWYVVSARPGADVRVGLKPGVTAEAFRRAIAEGTAENCLIRWALHAGDAVFVPAGTVHTIGPGLVLCEIQENSDLTYRVYDYRRRTANGSPRSLHIEKAFEVINFGEQSGGRIQPVRIRRGPLAESYFVACRHFATEKWEFAERIAAVTSAKHFDLLIFLRGRGRLVWNDGTVAYAPAQAWLLPASLRAYQLEPQEPTALLRTYVPGSLDDFVQRLREQRVDQAAWSRVIFP